MMLNYGTLRQRALDACTAGTHTREYSSDNVCACGAYGIVSQPDLPSATILSRDGGAPALPVMQWHPPHFEI
jgi:hypothetical protein